MDQSLYGSCLPNLAQEPEAELRPMRDAAEAKFLCLLLTGRGSGTAVRFPSNRRAEALRAELVSLMLCGTFQPS